LAHTTTLICLANSYRGGGHCVAGKELLSHRYGPWIRPVSLRNGAELSNAECQYADRSTPRLLDILRLGLLDISPSAHQTENVALDPARPWKKIGTLDWEALPELCDSPGTLWTLSEHTAGGTYNCITPEEAETFTHSLCLVETRDLRLIIGADRPEQNRPYFGAFTYNHIAYILRITDPVVLGAFMTHAMGEYALGEAFLCISLSHVFHGRCHKLIAGVITNPRLATP
jgi:hypothetical protein